MNFPKLESGYAYKGVIPNPFCVIHINESPSEPGLWKFDIHTRRESIGVERHSTPNGVQRLIEWALEREGVSSSAKWERLSGEAPSPKRGYVYFIEAHAAGLVKIGYSSNPVDRMKSIQGMSPVKVSLVGFIEGDMQDERDLHSRFAEYHSHGEWFQFNGDVYDYIKEVCNAGIGTVS